MARIIMTFEDFKAQWRLAYFLCRANRHIRPYQHHDGVLLWYLKLRRLRIDELVPHGESAASHRASIKPPFFTFRTTTNLFTCMPIAMKMMVAQNQVGKLPLWAEPWRALPWIGRDND